MVEKLIKIPSSDREHFIYARHAQSGSRQVVLHVNGLPGNMCDLLDVTSSEYFEALAVDHLRFGFYEVFPKARRLATVTLANHIDDFGTVLAYCRDRYDDVFLTAHSLGGLVALIGAPEQRAPNLRAISFWDPAFDVQQFWAQGAFLEPIEKGRVILKYGIDNLVNETFVAEVSGFPDARCRELAQHVTVPVQVLVPGAWSIFQASPQTSPEAYASSFRGAFEVERIPDANHRFTNRGTRQALFEATRRWFRRHGLKPTL